MRPLIVFEPDAALVQATADLLAARVALYRVQPGHRLIRLADAALEVLLSPRMVVHMSDKFDGGAEDRAVGRGC